VEAFDSGSAAAPNRSSLVRHTLSGIGGRRLPASVPSRGPVASAPLETVYLEVSNYCNSLCATCPLTFFGNSSPHNLSFEQFRQVVDAAPRLRRAVLHGLGEPLLNAQLPRMITYLKERGVHVVFNSNAIILTPRRQRQLIDAGLDEFRASLEAARPETYTKIRGVPAFERVVRNLYGFLELQCQMGVEHPRVSLWFTTLRENLAELPAVVEIAIRLGVPEVYVQRLVYFGEGLAVEEQSLYRRLQLEEEQLLATSADPCRDAGVRFSAAGATEPLISLRGSAAERPWQQCRRPWTVSYVTARGDVLTCCFVPFVTRDQRPFRLGNAFEQPLSTVWNGEGYQSFRRRFLSAEPPACCADCGARWST
jgi:MoaA/NifB/PqqE/SkfB family radical SAM enzyme